MILPPDNWNGSLKPVKAQLTLPSSKSLTQRALLCASLAQGQSVIMSPNYGEDLLHLIKALQQLGVRIHVQAHQLVVHGVNGKFRIPKKPIDVGDSGANWRFLAELVPAGTTLLGSTQLQRRLQVNAPTSQTVSGQLLAGKISKPPPRLVSKGYVAMTMAVMKDFTGKGRKYTIEPDASAATYWQTYNWITGSKISFTNWPTQSLQPDFQYTQLLRQLQRGTTEFDLGGMPDSVMSLAVAAIFTTKKITITNIAQLVYKESNRLQALHYNLTKLKIKNTITRDSITIYGTGGKFKRVKIKTFHDHRIAMAFGILGLPVDDPKCVQKSYPNFWQDYKTITQANVVLTGMRGVGKTTLGQQLARQWKMEFVDSDQLIEQATKQPITELVQKKGWKYFRDLEYTITQHCAKLHNTVIATGGGTLMYQRNYQLLKTNYCMLLTAPISVIKNRLQQSYIRPSLGDIGKLWQKRKARYYQVADKIIRV